jgi:DNA-binding transcriptional regulator YhcF (GntR family)
MSFSNFNIEDAAGHTKLQQLVHFITEAIAKGELKAGDSLPSVNRMSSESGYARDTVFKAYNILKQRSIIESVPMKGYFVANESYKVCMLLDDFSAFKEQLYQSFRQNLPESYSVDLLFHHYNRDVFTQLIENSLGRYSMYVVMNIGHHAPDPILNKIDTNKLLLLDMGKPDSEKYNYLLQDFSKAVSHCLEQGAEHLRKYRELILVYSENDTPHPSEVLPAVEDFCKSQDIAFKRLDKFDPRKIQKGQAYFVIRDTDLVEVILTCRSQNLQLGRDVGVISYNDTPMKQIVGNGITVISTNFEQMGRDAAAFVQHKHKIAKVLPTSLILRDSL